MEIELLLSSPDPFVLEEDDILFEYPTAKLVPEFEAGGPSVRVICIAEFEGRVLCAVPEKAWHRNKPKRQLAAGTFSKPVAVEISGCRVDDRSFPEEGALLKIWMGFFSKPYAEANFQLSSFTETLDVDFDDIIPYAAPFKDLAVEHFAFFSAGEATDGAGQPLLPEAPGS